MKYSKKKKKDHNGDFCEWTEDGNPIDPTEMHHFSGDIPLKTEANCTIILCYCYCYCYYWIYTKKMFCFVESFRKLV